MAVIILVAGHWNTSKIPSLQDWRKKMHYMFLITKLTTINKIRGGNESNADFQ